MTSGSSGGDPSVGESLASTSQALRAAGIDQPHLEASLLVALSVERDREWVLAHPEFRLDGGQRRRLSTFLTRRTAREPMAYLRGEQEFYGRSFLVDRSALIPRPESELLVELGIDACRRARDRGSARPWLADVGTGSGAIALSLAAECRDAQVVAADRFAGPIRLARRNGKRLDVSNVSFVQCDLLSAFTHKFDVVVGNLPYIPINRRPQLQPELSYEPPAALFAGESGLEVIGQALDQARSLTARSGTVIIEIDSTQGEHVIGLARRLFPDAACSIIKDYSGLDRVLLVRR